jgi:hypothetical protein
MTRRIGLLGLFSLYALFILANSAQPGIRNAGGGGFTLLFPEDSVGYKKIQMERERVSIQLYRGFAVVKGEYWMKNTTGDSITIRAGYPLNAIWDSDQNASDLTEIYFDKLYKIKVNIDGREAEITQKPADINLENIESFSQTGENNWYVWSMGFRPDDITKIEVYFIVNTNDANVSLGYSREYYNGFVYVLESGSTWKPPIGAGTIMIQLMDGLEKEDIQGISPDSIFDYDEDQQILRYQFQQLEPTHENNIVITYAEKQVDFNFEGIIAENETYFSAVDQLSSLDPEAGNYVAKDFDSPYDISTVNSVTIFFFVALVILPIIFILGFGFLIYRIIRRRRRNI